MVEGGELMPIWGWLIFGGIAALMVLLLFAKPRRS